MPEASLKACIIYCRVSSKEQVEGTSLENQERLCREYATRNGLNILKVFVEMGESAKTADRTEFTKAIAFCTQKKGRVYQFIVYKLIALLETRRSRCGSEPAQTSEQNSDRHGNIRESAMGERGGDVVGICRVR